MSKLHVSVTDHAVVRFMERALSMDIEKIRAQLSAHVRDAVASGASSYFDGTFTYVLDGRNLVTIFEGRSKSSGAGREGL